MAKLVTKFKYLKPENRKGLGGYANYIATRKGVDKIDESRKYSPATGPQKKIIEKLLSEFPSCISMLEYEDYIAKPNIGNASEFISRAVEEHADDMLSSKTYADYIATRPRAERIGSHGLFTDDGVTVNLSKVSEALNLHEGNVWTVIISLRREDAERLGYNTGERWRNMLRSQTQELADQFHIPIGELKWFAAFHNEGHHPHIHMIIYSDNPKQGHLSQYGIEKLRSSFGREIFSQDLMAIYEKQTKQRDDLRLHSKSYLSDIIARINTGTYDNPIVEEKLLQLADRLSKTSGKKQYGYLKADIKSLVDSIVDEIAKDPRIAALYDLWYESREEIISTYTDEMPERIPLSQNKEFKSVRNAVIQEAMNIVQSREPIEIPDLPDEEAEDDIEDAEVDVPRKKSSMWDFYREAKEHLVRDSVQYDPERAVDLLIESAKLGCGVAKYRLGKLFLLGDDVPKNVDYALRWLEEAAAEYNPYAEYLLGKMYLAGADVEQDTPKAEDLLRRSVSQGNKYAAYTLGKCYLNGDPFNQNIPEAISLLTKAADSGMTVAQYVLGKLLFTGDTVPQDIGKALEYLDMATASGNPYAAYLAGKIYMSENEFRDIHKAIRSWEIAAKEGNSYAEYQLGKLCLYGSEVERDYEKAMRYLRSSAEHGNQYAEQLLHSIHSNRNWSASMAVIRLLHHISRLIQNRLDDERKGKAGSIDRKLKRIIDEKKQAHGLKQG